MNILNEKLRVITTQIAIEKNKQNPDSEVIRRLEAERDYCLRELRISVKSKCSTCMEYYCFFDDDGEVLSEGCKLDIPLFDKNKSIICSSYRRKKI